MRWEDTDEGFNFGSVEVRDFVIESILKTNAFSELKVQLELQKKTPSTVLSFPPDYRKDVGDYISLYEPAFDREYNFRTGKPVAPVQPEGPLHGWVRFWHGSLIRIQREVEGYLASNVDFETICLYLSSEFRNLIMRAGSDSYRLRNERIAKRVEPNWWNRVLWWIRTRRLEWRIGKNRKLFGPYEKYETAEPHDSTKVVQIVCGYCGTKIEDNSKRPKKYKPFPEMPIDVVKYGSKVVISAQSYVGEYDKPFPCPSCEEQIKNVHMTRCGRAIVALLL